MLSSQEVIGITIGISILIVFLFNFRKFSGVRSDTRLHLKQQRGASPQDAKAGESGGDRGRAITIDPATLQESNAGLKTKNLNVLFMYNGHSFDAHEILGVPPGSSLKSIEQAYRQLQQTVAPDSREFIETAYRVLKMEHQRD